MITEKFLSLGASDGYVRLAEQPLVRQDGDTFFVMASVAAHLDLFAPGRHQRPARYLTVQPVFSATRFEDVGKYPMATPFEVMLTIFRFLDKSPEPALSFMERFSVEIGLKAQDIIYLAPREMGIRDAVIELGVSPDRVISWDRSLPLKLGPDRPEGYYLKMFVTYRNGLIPIATLGFLELDGHVAVDSALFLERLDFMIRGLRHWYEGPYFLPLVKAVRDSGELAHLAHTEQYAWANLLRATAALIADGVLPTGKGPGHVVRKMCRQLAGMIAGIQLSSETLRALSVATLACLRELSDSVELVPDTLAEVLARLINGASRQIARELAGFKDRLLQGPIPVAEVEVWKSERGLQIEWMEAVAAQARLPFPTITPEEKRFWMRNECYSFDESKVIDDPVAFLLAAESKRMRK